MNKNKIFIFIFLFVLIFSIASVSASDVGEISDHKDFSSPHIQIRENINSLSLEKNCLEDSANSTLVQSSLEKTSTDTISSDSDKSSSDKSSSDKSDSDKSGSDKSSGSNDSKSSADSNKSNKVINKTNSTGNTSKNSTKIINSGSTINKGKNYKITLKDAKGKILSNKRIVFIFGTNKVKYIKTTDKNGVAYLTINAAAGKYTLKYSFLGDDSYSASSGSVKLNVQSKTTISGSGSSIVKGNDYKVYLKDSNGKALSNKKIVFTFGSGTTYTKTTDSNGMAYLTINAAAGKTYPLKYEFSGDDSYGASSGSVTLKVLYKTTMSGSGSSIVIGNDYKVYLKDADGKALSNKKIVFTFGSGTTYTKTTDSNGMAYLTINAAAGSTYPLKYAFSGDDSYGASSGSVTLKVLYKTTMSGSGSSIVKGNDYKVYLKDSNGKALSNKKIVFTFGSGTTYTKTTDSNGMACLTINAAAGKTYPLKFEFSGDDSYGSSSGSVDLKVQSNTIITGSGTVITQGDSYIVTLKDADGKALSNKKIVFTFGSGTTYTRTTDSNGRASLTINAAAGKTYPLKFEFAGDDSYGACSGSVDLQVKSPRGNQSQFKKGLNEIASLSDAELAQYLKASGYDSIDAAIQALANKLTSGKTSVWDKATAIFNYVRDNIAYSYYSNSQKGAAKTLSSGTGNCCDQANLVVALCRAAGIPARFSHAKNCKFNSGLVTGHVWAQIYIDGVWYSADATSKSNSIGNIQNWNTNSFTNLNQYIHLPF